MGTLDIREVIHGDKSLKSVQAAAPFYYVTIDYEKILKGARVFRGSTPRRLGDVQEGA